MANKNPIPYLPSDSNYTKQTPQRIKAYSLRDYTELPDPVADSIIPNNITTWGFNHTHDDLE
ncbi:MAG: hypothetical protein Q8936_15380 [Bacillota bacterium]|nr:hypothetical protein [Bacillota bacterium]